jgi:hypothetical protein
MRALMWVVAGLAVVLFVVGVAVKAAAFLLWTAPALIAAALLLLIMDRSGVRRIPR